VNTAEASSFFSSGVSFYPEHWTDEDIDAHETAILTEAYEAALVIDAAMHYHEDAAATAAAQLGTTRHLRQATPPRNRADGIHTNSRTAMYQLTVVDKAHNITSEHPEWEQAHDALTEYVIDADYYLRLILTTRPHTSYDLLDFGEDSDHNTRRPTTITGPRTVGRATIEKLTESTRDADSPYYVAAAAHRWISDYQALSNNESPDNAGTRYALTVLAYAQAEAQCWFSAGALLREAAHLAGTEPIPDPHQLTLARLPQMVCTRIVGNGR
jgi:hypothetical protein